MIFENFAINSTGAMMISVSGFSAVGSPGGRKNTVFGVAHRPQGYETRRLDHDERDDGERRRDHDVPRRRRRREGMRPSRFAYRMKKKRVMTSGTNLSPPRPMLAMTMSSLR